MGKKRQSISTTVRLPPSVHDMIDDVARAEYRSSANLIVRLVIEALRERGFEIDVDKPS